MHIHEFQQMMRRLYYHRDKQRGIPKTYQWLTDEIKELGEALDQNNKQAIEEELADATAWLASLANITNTDLEKAALKKYNNKCPKCQHTPCKCTF